MSSILEVVEVHPTQLVHVVGVVNGEVGVVSVGSALRTGKPVGAAMVTHHEGGVVIGVVEARGVATMSCEYHIRQC